MKNLSGDIANVQIFTSTGTTTIFNVVLASPSYTLDDKIVKLRLETTVSPVDNHFLIDDTSIDAVITLPGEIEFTLKPATINQSITAGVPGTFGALSDGDYFYALEYSPKVNLDAIEFRAQGVWIIGDKKGFSGSPVSAIPSSSFLPELPGNSVVIDFNENESLTMTIG